MPKTGHGQVVLLLADGFEEIAVTILLTTLRQAGLAVTVVGLRSGRVIGAHGLTIMPDTSLDWFLEKMPFILAVVLPGGTGHLGRLRVDPRVGTLLGQCIDEKGMLVGLQPYVTELTCQILKTEYPILWLIPKPGQQLEDFATMIAHRLQDLQRG